MDHGNGTGAGRRARPLLAALLLVATLPAAAHDFWIEPEPFTATTAVSVAVTLRVGEHFSGESVPYISDWVERFEAHDGQGVRALGEQIGDDPAARLELRAPGPTWVLYQSRDDFVELPPEKFRDYLALEGMEYVLPLRAARGQAERVAREYYVRCAKALLRRSGAPSGSGLEPTLPLGLTLEIVPLQDPHGLAPGAPLEVQVLHRGQPVAGLLLKAFTREAPGQELRQRTAADGRARLLLDRPGQWLVKTVHMLPVDGDRYAEWRSYWASLTFALGD
ncbi:MAG TPA: DUF4198 domain-containing protein [Gammaproteobacteria bacterium]